MNWHQNEGLVIVSIYTRANDISDQHFVVDICDSKRLLVQVMLSNQSAYHVRYQLTGALTGTPQLKIASTSGKVELHLEKAAPQQNPRWPSLGSPLAGNQTVDDPDLDTFRAWRLAEVKPVTVDVDHYILEPPQGLHFAVLPGHHVLIKANIQDMEVIRNYTPTLASLNTEEPDGKLHLLIKLYPDGAMTSYLKNLAVGAEVWISNPSPGNLDLSRIKKANQIILLAAGSGFTPMVKLIHWIRTACSHDPEVLLVCFNKTEQDIIWKDDLRHLISPTFRLHHVLSQDESWSGYKGRVSAPLLAELLAQMPESTEQRTAVICGPSPFTQSAESILSTDLNFSSHQIMPLKS